jgi:hypothetical protein
LKIMSPPNGLGAKGVFVWREGGGVQVDLKITDCAVTRAKAIANNMSTIKTDEIIRNRDILCSTSP